MQNCVHLKYFAKDPRIPIHYDDDSQCYYLELSNDLIIKPMYCNICGGHKRFNPKSKFSPCECSRPGRWSRDPSIPIQYDPAINAYHLLTQQGRRLHLGFCPYCGGQLHQIPIEEIASAPSRADMEQIMEKVRPARTVEQLIEILGPPDEKHGPFKIDPIDKEIYGTEDIKQMLEYKNLTPTAILQVTESGSGALRYSFSGHQSKEHRLVTRIRSLYYRIRHYLGRFNFVLWEYAPDTSVEKLLRHHKMCRRLITLRMYSLITMLSTLFIGIIVGGFSKLDMVLILAMTAICFLVYIPSLFAEALLYEIEENLKRKSHPIPGNITAKIYMGKWYRKMMLWVGAFFLLIVFCILKQKLT